MESDYMPAVIPLSSYVALQVMLAPSFEKKKKEKCVIKKSDISVLLYQFCSFVFNLSIMCPTSVM